MDAVKRNAPRATGRLARSIRLRAMKRSRSRVGARITTNAYDNLYQGKTFYAAFQEFGWKTGKRVRNTDLGIKRFKRRTESQVNEATRREGRRRQVPAKSFMKRAAEARKDAALKIYKEEIEAGILKIVGAS